MTGPATGIVDCGAPVVLLLKTTAPEFGAAVPSANTPSNVCTTSLALLLTPTLASNEPEVESRRVSVLTDPTPESVHIDPSICTWVTANRPAGVGNIRVGF